MLIEPRSFNTITILNDFTIRKSSKDKTKLLGEYRWLRDSYGFNCPKVSNFVECNNPWFASYDIEYIHGKSLAQLYINEELSLDEFKNILLFLKSVIITNRNIGVIKSDLNNISEIEKMYTDKTWQRLNKCGYNFNKSFILNEQLLPSLKEIIEDCKVEVNLEDLSYIHGDLCFSNIILSEDYYKSKNLEKSLYFIDPRGVLSNGDISAVGDYKYEIGKLAHSIIGKYDLIKSSKLIANENATYNIKYDYDISEYKKQLDNIFFEIFGDKEVWYNIMINLFLSMLPLHSDNQTQQDTLFANALRLYKEKQQKFK